MSRILIIADLEGCVDVTDMDAARFPPAEDKEALASYYREICTRETLAVIKGLGERDVKKICVYESHPYAILESELPVSVEFRRGCEESEYLRVAQKPWDGVILIGAHAAAGTPNATLCHTLSHRNPQRWYINGLEVGEIGIEVLLLSMESSPVVMVTGGICLANEIVFWCPAARHIIVKRDFGWNRARSLELKEALKLIESGAKNLVMNIYEEIPVSAPYRIEIVFTGKSLKHILFKKAWLFKRWLINRPTQATFRFRSGALEVTGEDPRSVMNILLGKNSKEI